jgi:hypothetical protein
MQKYLYSVFFIVITILVIYVSKINNDKHKIQIKLLDCQKMHQLQELANKQHQNEISKTFSMKERHLKEQLKQSKLLYANHSQLTSRDKATAYNITQLIMIIATLQKANNFLTEGSSLVI